MSQLPVPVQAPLQPLNTEPAAGAAARLTTVPELKVEEHVAPQVMPAGVLVTAPVPVPAKETPRVNSGAKLADTDVSAESDTVQVPVPVQAEPLQPVKTNPAAAAGVRVTAVPLLNELEQVAPQAMPAGFEVTDPPLTLFATESWYVIVLNLAPTVVFLTAPPENALLIAELVPLMIVHDPVPAQEPVQPSKNELGPGVATNVTLVPEV